VTIAIVALTHDNHEEIATQPEPASAIKIIAGYTTAR